MEIKYQFKLLLLFVVIATLTILGGEFSHASSSSNLFSTAHKEYLNSKVLKPKVNPADVSVYLGIADQKTKLLEQQIKVYHKAEEMGFWNRWLNNVNIYDVRENYARHVLSHLTAMTDVLKLRRLNGNRFSSISEFQFKILLRQSEFVLNSNTTKNSFVALSRKSDLSQRMDKAIYNYNQERLVFDSKMIAWVE